MKLHLQSVTPTTRDVVYCSVFALVIAVIGNAYQVINYYVFRPDGTPAPQTTHDLIVAVMAKIDTFQPSAAIVTFIFWALVGLGVMAIFQGLVHVLRRVAHLQVASSRYYRHNRPKPLTRAAFWKQWAFTAIGSFLAFCTALFIFSFFVLCIVPVGIIYTRIFFFFPTPFNLFYALMGLCMMFIGLLLTVVGIRLIISRRRILRLA